LTYVPVETIAVWRGGNDSDESGLTNVAADKHFPDAASPQWW